MEHSENNRIFVLPKPLIIKMLILNDIEFPFIRSETQSGRIICILLTQFQPFRYFRSLLSVPSLGYPKTHFNDIWREKSCFGGIVLAGVDNSLEMRHEGFNGIISRL